MGKTLPEGNNVESAPRPVCWTSIWEQARNLENYGNGGGKRYHATGNRDDAGSYCNGLCRRTVPKLRAWANRRRGERVEGLQWVAVGAVPSKCFLAQRPGPRAGAHLAPGMSVTDRQVNARPLLKVRFTGIVVCCAQDFCEQAPEGAPSYSLVLRLHCFPSCAVAPDLPIAGDRGLE